MHQIESTYKGQLRTENIHLKSNNKIITDAPTDNNGKGEAFSPTDLVCAALSSCMMTIMGIYANKNGIDISGMTSEVTKVMSANPRKISTIKINFSLTDLQASTEQIEGLRNAALTCPVALSLSSELKQEVSFNF